MKFMCISMFNRWGLHVGFFAAADSFLHKSNLHYCTIGKFLWALQSGNQALSLKFLVNLAEGFWPLCTRKLIQAFFSDLNYGNCVWFGPIPDNFEISDFMCVFHSSLGWALVITLQPVEGSCKFPCYLGNFPICLIPLKVSSVSHQSTLLTSHVPTLSTTRSDAHT